MPDHGSQRLVLWLAPIILMWGLAACAVPSDAHTETAAAGRETDSTADAGKSAGAPAPAEAGATDAPAASQSLASSQVLRGRLQALMPASCRIDEVRTGADGAKVIGSADSNAAIAEAMRAIDRAHAGGAVLGPGPAVDLGLLERRSGEKTFHFELNVRSARLLAE